VNSKEYDQTGIEITEKYIFDQDESPGLYGEIADYWRSYEDSDITDRNETSNDNYNNSTVSILKFTYYIFVFCLLQIILINS
jgi:hypothetical protein